MGILCTCCADLPSELIPVSTLPSFMLRQVETSHSLLSLLVCVGCPVLQGEHLGQGIIEFLVTHRLSNEHGGHNASTIG